MLKNREFRVRLAKTDPIESAPDSSTYMSIDPTVMHNITKDLLTHTAIVVGAVFVTKQVCLSAREIAFLAASKKFG